MNGRFTKKAVMLTIAAMTVMPAKAQKWENLADTPQMGWSTWNKFQGNITDDEVSHRSTSFDTLVYDVYNLWTHKAEGNTSVKDATERTVTVMARDVVSYRLTPRPAKKTAKR